MTRQRQLILKILRHSEGHLTAEEIYRSAKAQMPSLAIATVYRNLNLMSQSGEVKRITVSGSPDYFDKNVEDHEHLICQRCGQIRDIHIEGLEGMLEKCTDGRLETFDLQIKYICPACLKIGGESHS